MYCVITCNPVEELVDGFANCFVNVGDCLSERASVIFATIGLLLLESLPLTAVIVGAAIMILVWVVPEALLLASCAAIWLIDRFLAGEVAVNAPASILTGTAVSVPGLTDISPSATKWLVPT